MRILALKLQDLHQLSRWRDCWRGWSPVFRRILRATLWFSMEAICDFYAKNRRRYMEMSRVWNMIDMTMMYSCFHMSQSPRWCVCFSLLQVAQSCGDCAARCERCVACKWGCKMLLFFCFLFHAFTITWKNPKKWLSSLRQVPDLSTRVVSYRAGYPPALRRQLERDIFHRKVWSKRLEIGT